ncbi:54S ribosomal protein L27, mitochondrial [Smittium culicis]|uniref:54S ribosomal protein L27, mitochondrial n=1 Tax=Smittium culicis TaxID=133412 RepID=A0A1R1XST3_9FUNG|nr:54S ribosomal protein L27, mitochondrial [Smittium culicis]OMJ24059.1 54S ribosomal protein L27, mitochondrial [Smittium culicis]
MNSAVVKGLYRGAKHGVLTSKQGRNFYKGNKTGSTGRHTKHGSYVIEWNKVRTYPVPDLTDFKLKAYVSHRTEKVSSKMPSPDDFIRL